MDLKDWKISAKRKHPPSSAPSDQPKKERDATPPPKPYQYADFPYPEGLSHAGKLIYAARQLIDDQRPQERSGMDEWKDHYRRTFDELTAEVATKKGQICFSLRARDFICNMEVMWGEANDIRLQSGLKKLTLDQWMWTFEDEHAQQQHELLQLGEAALDADIIYRSTLKDNRGSHSSAQVMHVLDQQVAARRAVNEATRKLRDLRELCLAIRFKRAGLL